MRPGANRPCGRGPDVGPAAALRAWRITAGFTLAFVFAFGVAVVVVAVVVVGEPGSSQRLESPS